ncbi:DUF58 domain-containing protein [Mangrovihabitans endophyticus]|nr:DUF58 domain-containing protein [Mangrovihabitans endophyticus]
MFHATAVMPIAAPTVLPRPERLAGTPATNTVLSRVGEHPSRQGGSGIEFTAIRPYQIGDQLRDVHWAASSRQRRTMVTVRAADLAADLIIAIDVFGDIAGTPQQSTLDVSVRAATTLVGTALAHRDRVGVIAVGGLLQWLTPATGRIHLYRIADLILSTRAAQISVVNPDPSRLPGQMLPPDAQVIVLTPLADERIMPVLHNLARRRLHTSIIDVLGHPRPNRSAGSIAFARRRHATPHGDDLAERLWQLDRAATHADLVRLGMPVQVWTGDTALQLTISDVARAWQRRRP